MVENSLLEPDEFDDYMNKELNWDGTCPACISSEDGRRSELITCLTCKIIGCERDGCDGYEIDAIKRCIDHPKRAYCQNCRGKGGPSELIACPDCDYWYCYRDLRRCSGRTLHTKPQHSQPSTIRPENTPNFYQKTKTHDTPNVEPCKRCIGAKDAWPQCIECSWGKSVVCKDCAPNGGFKCSAGHIRICDICSTSRLPVVWPCPVCGKLFCQKSCEGIDRCVGCGSPTLCTGCSKLQELSNRGLKIKNTHNEIKNPLVRLESPSEGCSGRFSTTCITGGLQAACENCFRYICKDCSGADKCVDCGKEMCSGCMHDECSCGGYGEKETDRRADECQYDA